MPEKPVRRAGTSAATATFALKIFKKVAILMVDDAVAVEQGRAWYL